MTKGKGYITSKQTSSQKQVSFGDPYSKRTLLWLKGLEPLLPTNQVESQGSWLPSNTSGFRKNQKSQKGYSDSKDYSLTFQGIADAMAEQWGSL